MVYSFRLDCFAHSPPTVPSSAVPRWRELQNQFFLERFAISFVINWNHSPVRIGNSVSVSPYTPLAVLAFSDVLQLVSKDQEVNPAARAAHRIEITEERDYLKRIVGHGWILEESAVESGNVSMVPLSPHQWI
jgi:hypothetical protein